MGRIIRARLLSPFVSQKLVNFTVKPNKEDLQFLKELIEAGKVTPVIDRTYSLTEVPEAIRYVEEGHTQGKVRHRCVRVGCFRRPPPTPRDVRVVPTDHRPTVTQSDTTERPQMAIGINCSSWTGLLVAAYRGDPTVRELTLTGTRIMAGG
jgi:Zinc-binding dehydrogenase